MYKELTNKILEYIEENLYTKITIEELSRLFYFNKDYIMRLFKKEIHMTIIEYMNRKRVYNSLKGLQYTSDSILKISLNYGFVSQEYYSEIFTKIMGVNPNTYRKFSTHKSNISYDEIKIIREKLISLKYQLERIEHNRHPLKKSQVIQKTRYHF